MALIYSFVLVMFTFSTSVFAADESPSNKNTELGFRQTGIWTEDSKFVLTADLQGRYLFSSTHWEVKGSAFLPYSDVRITSVLPEMTMNIYNFAVAYHLESVSDLNQTSFGALLEYQIFKLDSRVIPSLGLGAFASILMPESTQEFFKGFAEEVSMYLDIAYFPVDFSEGFEVNESLRAQLQFKFRLTQLLVFQVGAGYKLLDFDDAITTQNFNVSTSNVSVGVAWQF